MKQKQHLWVEKYRPTNINEYVFQDERLRKQVKSWIKEKSIPHLLLSGPSGTGKSSLARVILNEIGIDDGDILYINASDDNGIETVRSKIMSFASTISMGDFKVALLEEFDMFTIQAQSALRRVMEDYAATCRFILTANFSNKILPPIKSRIQEIVINNLELENFKLKMVEILVSENIEIRDEDILDTYIKDTYPDLRKCINTMQLNTNEGILLNPSKDDNSSADWQLLAIDMMKKGNISDARKLIVSQIRNEEYEDFYRLCYRNLDWFSKNVDLQDEAILIIRDALVKHAVVCDPEINLSATLVQLTKLGK